MPTLCSLGFDEGPLARLGHLPSGLLCQQVLVGGREGLVHVLRAVSGGPRSGPIVAAAEKTARQTPPLLRRPLEQAYCEIDATVAVFICHQRHEETILGAQVAAWMTQLLIQD